MSEDRDEFQQFSHKYLYDEYVKNKKSRLKVTPEGTFSQYLVLSKRRITSRLSFNVKVFITVLLVGAVAGGVIYVTMKSGERTDNGSTDAASGSETSAAKGLSSFNSSFEIANKLSSCFSNGTSDTNSTLWTTADYCGFLSKSNCNQDSIASYTCVPSCLETCPNAFCESMATLVFNCDDGPAAGSFTSELELRDACVASYAASIKTLTVLSFDVIASLAGVMAASLKTDEQAQYAARLTVARAISKVPVDHIVITNISDAAADRRYLRSRAVSDMMNMGLLLSDFRTASASTIIRFRVTVQLETLGYTSADAEEAHATLSTQIAKSVDSGEFMRNLQLYSNSSNSTGFAVVDVIVMSSLMTNITVSSSSMHRASLSSYSTTYPLRAFSRALSAPIFPALLFCRKMVEKLWSQPHML